MSSRSGEFRFRRWAPVQILVYLLLRAIIMVIDMFPFEKAADLGRFLSLVIRTIDRKHRRIAVKNLERTPDVCPPRKIPAFVRKVYRHIALGFVEMLMIPRLMVRGQLTRYVRIEGQGIVDRLLAEGKGLIFAIGHLGNWEIAGLGATMAGYKLNSIARPVENPWVDRYLNRFRTQTGQEIIPKHGALGAMVRSIRANEPLVIQIDQDARHSGVFVNFLGRPASTHRSPAVLSLKYGTPIVPVNIYREGGMHWMVVTEPLRPEGFAAAADPVQALTQAYSDRFEAFVRQHPDQWFWVHDRWKTAERRARVSEVLV